MKRIGIVLLLLFLLAGTVFAQESDDLVDTSSMTEELPQEAQDALSGLSPTAATDFWGNCKRLVQRALRGSDGAVKEGLRLCAVLLAVVTLCAMAKMAAEHDLTGAATAVGALGLCAVAVGSFHTMISLASSTVQTVTDYTGCMLPVMASAAETLSFSPSLERRTAEVPRTSPALTMEVVCQAERPQLRRSCMLEMAAAEPSDSGASMTTPTTSRPSLEAPAARQRPASPV